MSRRLFTLALALFALSACSFRNVSCGPQPPAPVDPVSLSGAGDDLPMQASDSGLVGIAFLGDSLTSGFGLLSDEAYPNRVVELFYGEGYSEVEVLNAGLSGDTTAGGLRRVDGVLQPGVHILVVALGGNDALRGLSTTQTFDNLAGIIETALDRGVMVLLAGMQAPTNLGMNYQDAFREVFLRLSNDYAGSIEFVPFLLEGVAANSRLNQADGIHPNQAGQVAIAELLYPPLRDMADRLIFSGGG